MYCVVKTEGKEKRIHVNRLTRKYHWTEAMPDTAIWGSEIIARKPEEAKEERIDDTRIVKGETIIFPLEMEEGSQIPFGIGIVTDARCNAVGQTNLAFRLCWHQASTSQIYYQDRKIYPTHTPCSHGLEC
jgi:hypothetical protein